MGRLILFLALCLPCGGAISLVAHTAAGSPNTSTVTTPAIDTTGANLIVAYVAADHAGGFPPVTDNMGNAYIGLALHGGVVNPSGGRFFYCLSPIVGTGHTFSYADGSQAPSIAVAAFSGISAFDSDTGNGVGTTTTVQAGTSTPCVSGELVITGVGFYGSLPITIDSSFSITDTVTFAPGLHYGEALAYLITDSAVNPTWSESSASAISSSIASFIPVGSGSTVTKRRILN